MAEPIEFAEQNMLLLPPDGREDDVRPMRVLADGSRTISCWRLSSEELAEVSRTGLVWLDVWAGARTPPVFVTGRKDDVILRVFDA